MRADFGHYEHLVSAALERPDQGDLVGVLEIAADGDPARDPGHAADLAV